MRIIAGVARGLKLANVASITRPTSDRAREALFSSLTSEFGDFLGIRFLDLFAGSGAIGLEALSRGATIVHAAEVDSQAAGTIESNHALVKKTQPVGNFQLFTISVQRFLGEAARERYHIVYIDPPFDFSDSEVAELLQKLNIGGFLTEDAVIAVERATKAAGFSWPEGFRALRERKYGAISIFYGACEP